MMKVERITYGELKSGPGYNNRKAETTIVLEEGDTPEAAIAKAKEIVTQALAEPEYHAISPSHWDPDWDPDIDDDEEDDEEEEFSNEGESESYEGEHVLATPAVAGDTPEMFEQEVIDAAQEEENLEVNPDDTPKEAL